MAFITPFRQDESGIALSEALITFPIVLLVFAVFFEFGYAMSQWNQTVKALQYGARLAAVSDPLAARDDFDAAFPISAANPVNNGSATPNDATVSVRCTGDPKLSGIPLCDAAPLNRIVFGRNGRPGMNDINWRIKPENLIVTYQRSGLGYWGRPEGPVLTARLEAHDVKFDLPLLGGLLGIDDITIPAHPVTITTEDLKTCSTC
ncbi:TadE/TadG family type IV pilus assembly protein [Sinorhizobium fredii]|uniref:TadE/TadG family type IV pilus assembly protein n=1 Tax=Rhizobium fredii TaxID=380 RepID=UPI002108AC11|nr:TadE/TadG family type IV pilus assembly protein [Sinorhizobium fredii]